MAETVYMAPERVDRYSASQVQEELDKLMDGGAKELVFDMADMKYISSAGLRVLLATQQRLGSDGSLVLANVPEVVMEVLRSTGFESFMKIR